jgi:hypothetical protein
MDPTKRNHGQRAQTTQSRSIISEPISDVLIYSMGALFVDDTNMYTWREHILDPGELWKWTQIEIKQWSSLLNATKGALKPGISLTTPAQAVSGPMQT